MSLKLKALGLIATLAMGATLAMNATAETGGHFTSGEAHTILLGEQATELEFIDAEVGIAIRCKKAVFHGTTTTTTETQITIIPTYSECSSGLGVEHVTMNGCDYVLTIGKKSTVHNTFHIVCPAGAKIELHQTSGFGTCTYTIFPQTPTSGGIAYTTGGTGKTHDLTLDVTLSGIHMERHGGPCAIVPTIGLKNEIKGTITLKGFNTAGTQVGITATGSEG